MAKAKHGEKSKAIREFLTANPNAEMNDIVAALKASHISASMQMIYNVKAKLGKTSKKRGRKKGSVAKKNGAMVSLAVLVQAKKLADSLGGVEKAKAAMDALAKLQ